MSISTKARATCDRCKATRELEEGQRRPVDWSGYNGGESHLCGLCTSDRADMLIRFYSNQAITVEPRVRS